LGIKINHDNPKTIGADRIVNSVAGIKKYGVPLIIIDIGTAITFDVRGLEIHIFTEIHTIYKTGVEVEAMHSASVVALTMYDMLKPIDKNIEIKFV